MIKYLISMDEFVRKPKEPKINLDLNNIQKESSPAKSMLDNNSSDPQNFGKKKSKFSFKVPTPKTKKQWIIAVIAIVVALSATIFAVYWFILRDNSEPVKVQQAVPPACTMAAS